MKPVLPCLQISSGGIDSRYLKLVPSDNNLRCLPKGRAEIVKRFPFVQNSHFLRRFKLLIMDPPKSVAQVCPPHGFSEKRRGANYLLQTNTPHGADRPLHLAEK